MATQMNKQINTCIRLLAKSYTSGQRIISISDLFPKTKLSQSQIQAVVEILQAKQVIKSTYQMGQLTPYQIQILPGVVDAESQIDKSNPAEQFEKRLMSFPCVAYAKWALGVLVAILSFYLLIKAL